MKRLGAKRALDIAREGAMNNGIVVMVMGDDVNQNTN